MIVNMKIMKKLVIKNNKTNKYIDIDHASGGYPYDTEVEYAKIWGSSDEAKQYYDHFKKNEDWSLHTLTIITTPCEW